MVKSGYIRVFRKFANWRFYGNCNAMAIFIHLLLSANIAERNYRGMLIHKGQALITESELSRLFDMSLSTVKRWLKKMDGNEIEVDRYHGKFLIITINNFEKYQDVQKKVTKKQEDEDDDW